MPGDLPQPDQGDSPVQWTPPPPGYDPTAGFGPWHVPGASGSYGSWGPQYPLLPPEPPRRRGPLAVLTIAAAAVVVGAAGVAGGVAIHARSTSSAPSAIRPTLEPVVPGSSAPSGGSSSDNGSSSSSSSSSSGSASSGGPLSSTDIAARIDPAVVDITTTLGSQGSAAGTGMVITSSGEVLTNNHVVQGATSIKAQIAGAGRIYTAHVLGVDPTDDIALLQLQNASGLTAINVGNSSHVAVGDQIVAIGNALGRGGIPQVSQGAITALNQTITASDVGGANAETLTGLIQINAPIQPGDSGGPLVNSAGQVIGIDTAAQTSGFRRRTTPSTIGFAIPINNALSIVHQIESGQPSPNIQSGQGPLLGVEVQDATGQTAGAMVASVQSGSPAASAGLVAGDVIVGLGGTTVDSAAALGTAIHSHHVGDRVQVSWVDQSGQQHSATVSLAAGPPA
jgi:S1-C subfamily serine protease